MMFRRAVFVVALPVAVLATAAIATGARTGSTAPPIGSGKQTKTHSVCGLGTGKKATKKPAIKLGAVATKQPGTDFTDIPNMAGAYFKCVNDNGGIFGYPIDYSIETEQTDPGTASAAAKKLIESTKVLGIVGNTSLIECAVNHKYYESKGYYIIDSGIAPECYGTSNSAAVNMGPRYSSDGATQYVISQKVNKIVFDQSNVPGTDYIVAGPQLVAKAAKIPFVGMTDDVPIQDANSVATKLVQAAGSNGAVVLNFTPPEALKILQAADQLGLVNRVKVWSCSTPCNTDFIPATLGANWNGKFYVNAELNLTSAPGPDSVLYRQILAAYKPSLVLGSGSFAQMGFTEARIATAALLSIKGKYTAKSVNAAFVGVKNFHTDILCSPWYYGKAPLHIPNNVDRTVRGLNGKMVRQGPCFKISAADPGIARVRAIEKKNPQLIKGKAYPLQGRK